MDDDGKSFRDGLSCSGAEPSIQILGLKVGCVEIIYSTKKNLRRPKKNATSRLQGGGWHFFLPCVASPPGLCFDDASI
jgi:hypothetical protein